MDWLEEARKVTTESRQKEYGHPMINFIRTALFWTIQDFDKLRPGKIHSPADVAWKMDTMKTAREIETHKDDNGIDKIGYMSCYNRIDNYMREKLGYPEGAEAFKTMDLVELTELFVRLSLDGDNPI